MECLFDMQILSETLFVTIYQVYLFMSTKKRFKKFLTLTKVVLQHSLFEHLFN